MTWYAAHIIVSIRPIKPRKGPILVYENVILIEASDAEEAWTKARKHAEASIVEDESLRVNGAPATESLVGIRKIIEVSNRWPLSQSGDRPVDGTEITYSEFQVKNERALSKLAKGEETLIRYME
jgi:hypothetical protein